MRKKLILGILLTAPIFLYSCGKTKRTADTDPEKQEKQQLRVPEFNADSAYAFTDAQCAFGPRVPNTEAHRKCGAYIAEKFREFGTTVTDQRADLMAYNGTILKARNIIAATNPEATQRILLCAHWDSRPWCDNDPDSNNWKKPVMGANDGASGVAVMLEIARQIQLQPIDIGIDFICFDAEDYGTPQWETENSLEDNSHTWCLGSQYWASMPHQDNYRATFGILLDMVGGRGCTFSQESYSQAYAPNIVARVWDTAARIGYGQFFPKRNSGYITDDHVPVNQIARIPCIDIVPYFTDGPSSFGPTWHTVNDTMENIDKNVLKAVGQTVMQVIYEEAQPQ